MKTETAVAIACVLGGLGALFVGVRLVMNEGEKTQAEFQAKAEAAAVEAARTPPPKPAPEPAVSSDFDESIKVMRETKERAEAVRLSFFDDYDDGGSGLVSYHPSTLYFTAWAARHMRWSDANASEVTHAQVMASSQATRGKRGCFSGKVQELKADELVGDPIHTASLWLDGAGGILKVVAVGDTSGIEADKHAKVCGVVIGTASYLSALDVRVKAVQIVGMFDTPKNRAKN